MLTRNNGRESARLGAVLKHRLDLPKIRGLCNWSCHLERLARAVAGGAFVLIGLALVLTFWLMPLGLLLAFVGTALILAGDAAPKRCHE